MAAKISTGEWKPGSRLPNEIELSRDLQVSQGTVRKALDQLERERLIDRQQGRGTFVIDYDNEEVAIRFSSIYNDKDQQIAGIAKCFQPETGPATIAEQQQLRVSSKDQIYRVVRERWYHDHPFTVELVRLPIRRFRGLSIDGLSGYRITALAQKHGMVVNRVVESVEPVACPAEEARHLCVEPGTPVLLLNRLAVTDDGTPLEWRTAWCHLRGERYLCIQQ